MLTCTRAIALSCSLLVAVLFGLLAGCNDVSSVSSPPAGPASLAVATNSLPPGAVGTAYHATVAAAGGTAPYTWIVSPALPPSLSLDTNTGDITGTPVNAGTTSHTFVVQDAAKDSATQTLSLSINPPGLAVTPITLPAGVVNQPYPVTTLTATGGVQPYTWSVSPALPNGLQFNIVSPGTISGTPLSGTAGTTQHTFTVMDTSTPMRKTASTGPLSLTITSAPPPLTLAPITLPNGVVNQAYPVTTLTATGGVQPYTWSVSPALPNGLQFNAGTVSGTPSKAGTTTHTFTVMDSSKPAQKSSVGPLSLTISPAVQPLLITTNSPLPNARVGRSYSTTLHSSGGTGPFSWSVSGQLPKDLVLNPSTGEISGTPALGTGGLLGLTYTFTYTVQDSSNPKQSNSKSLDLTITN
ncbi:MAG TPA: putative Ig domain-containing protein [Nitrospira sp.]|nr:putative Ig domain-containing protein [Nitrospira sp.]